MDIITNLQCTLLLWTTKILAIFVLGMICLGSLAFLPNFDLKYLSRSWREENLSSHYLHV
jgi:hypothetical protein